MIILGVILLIIVACAIYYYLKCTIMTAIVSLICAVFGLLIAMGYFDTVNNLVIARGMIGPKWPPVSLLVLFVLSAVLLRVLAGFVVGSQIDLGSLAQKIVVPVLGVFQGLILSGVLLVATGSVTSSRFISYARFSPGSESPANPSKLLINVDGMISGLFSWISQGSLSGTKSFAVYHADYLDQLHLSRIGQTYPLSGSNGMIVPSKGVRRRTFDEGGFLVVRMGLKYTSIKQGGAASPAGGVSFAPAQIRLVAKDASRPADTTGKGTVFYPVKFVENGKLVDKPLHEVITVDRDKDLTEKPSGGKAAWYDVAFDVPENQTPVLLQFKLGSVTELPKVQNSTDELERQLDVRENTSHQNSGS
ncbi:MAG: hypothetical protein JW828_06640 [Sedimentisphaerales bacterium]|nr:hypothetical protein [Sedimentisphaerales bacterium]